MAERRTPADASRRILIVSDDIPSPQLGGAALRLLKIIEVLHHRNFSVTLVTTRYQEDLRARSALPTGTEVLNGLEVNDLEALLGDRGSSYGFVLVSGMQNFLTLRQVLSRVHERSKKFKLIYDTPASISVLEASRADLSDYQPDVPNRRVEANFVADADFTLCASLKEAQRLVRTHGSRMRVASYPLTDRWTEEPFERRSAVVAIGPMIEDDSPNAEGMKWFLTRVLPLLEQKAGKIDLRVVGRCDAPVLISMNHPALLGPREDLEDVYRQARIFIAPVRFAAGIPVKVLEAAARGVPVVGTALLARQLRWRNREELLVGDVPHEFAIACYKLLSDEILWSEIRRAAHRRALIDFSPQAFGTKLGAVFGW